MLSKSEHVLADSIDERCAMLATFPAGSRARLAKHLRRGKSPFQIAEHFAVMATNDRRYAAGCVQRYGDGSEVPYIRDARRYERIVRDLADRLIAIS